MAKFLVFSDLHAHNFQFGSTVTSSEYGPINSRLKDTVVVLRDVLAYAISKGITKVLFGGDLFHERGRIDADVFETITQELVKFNKQGVRLWLLAGNHDFANREGTVTSIDHLGSYEGITILNPGWNTLSGMQVFAVPYTPDVSTCPVIKELSGLTRPTGPANMPHVLLGHIGIQGAVVGSDYILVSNTDADFDDLNTKAFSASFFGHYHKHQKLGKNAWYIGATNQHNWGDSGDYRGFLSVDCTTERCNVTKVANVSSSKFVKVRTEKDLENVTKNDFVRVMSTMSSSESTTDNKLAKQARDVAHMVEELEEEVITSDSLPKELFDPLAMAAEWVRLHGDDDPELLSLGTEILKKVVEEKL